MKFEIGDKGMIKGLGTMSDINTIWYDGIEVVVTTAGPDGIEVTKNNGMKSGLMSEEMTNRYFELTDKFEIDEYEDWED